MTTPEPGGTPGTPVRALPQRFWSKVDMTEGCWLWKAGTDTYGYGQYSVNSRSRSAHKVAYEALVGPVPAGLELDHLCRTPRCVRPAHMEPVTHGENVRRGRGPLHQALKTHCARGHLFDAANTYNRPGPRAHRVCRACDREKGRARRRAA